MDAMWGQGSPGDIVIIARGLRFSVCIKHCPKKEGITCLVSTFCSSVFSELVDTGRTVERASWPVLSWTSELGLHVVFSVCTHLFTVVWAKKYKHQVRLSVPRPRWSALPVSLHPHQHLSAGPGRRGQDSYLPWAMSKWRLREAKQVLQVCIIQTKETEPGFDPRSVLFGGLCF